VETGITPEPKKSEDQNTAGSLATAPSTSALARQPSAVQGLKRADLDERILFRKLGKPMLGCCCVGWKRRYNFFTPAPLKATA